MMKLTRLLLDLFGVTGALGAVAVFYFAVN